MLRIQKSCARQAIVFIPIFLTGFPVTPSTPSQPLKILHLASSERWTGVAEPVVSLACEQRRMGHRVWVGCVPGRSFERRVRERGLPLLEGLHLNRRLNPFHLISDLRLLPRFCRQNEIDIVHCHLLHDHWLATAAFRWLRPGSKGTRPLIVRTIHASAPPRSDIFHRRLFLLYTDRFVCISADAARRAEATLGLSPGSVPHVPGGVNTERFQPDLPGAEFRSKYDIPPEAPLAGIVARMRAGRGLRWLTQSIPQVLERIPNAHFIVVGRGELKHWFRDHIRNPLFRGQVHYAGYHTTDLPQAYAAMDVSLFLGLGSEGTCRAILEAMGCARPTVGVDAGAVPEIIDAGGTGFLVHDHDVNDLAEKLISLLQNRAKCAEMGKAARARVEDRFNETLRAQSFDEIYRGLIGLIKDPS